MKPVANLDEVEFTDVEDNGFYSSRRAQFSDGIGARKLGYNLTVLAAGQGPVPVPQPPRRGGDVSHPRR